MSSPVVSALLIEAPVNRHFAQLHRNPQALTDAVTLYLSQMVGFSGHTHEGERRFPSGQRTMLWVKRNLPSASTAVLERARRYYEESCGKE